MPLYRYQCEGCGNSFTLLHRSGDDGKKPKCPKCGSTSVHRVISSVGIRFKGNGFYRTDYGNNNNGGVASSTEGSDADDSGQQED